MPIDFIRFLLNSLGINFYRKNASDASTEHAPLGRMKFGKTENSEKTPKNPDITHHSCPSGDSKIRTRDPKSDRQVPIEQCFSNYDPRTTCGPRGLPLWSIKNIEG